jgi:radical SAM superfamily enzyme YgiQ (UPF0313 family)
MNVLFVFSLKDIRSQKKPISVQEFIPLGISYISSVLKKNGHSTKLLVISSDLGDRNNSLIDNYLKEFRPSLVCFTAVCTEYFFISRIAKYIKNRYPNIYLLVGGAHVSVNAEDVVRDEFDAICIGEGEFPTLELVSQLEKGNLPSGIPNLWIKSGSTVEQNPTRSFINDLDKLPFPDRDMWQEWIEEERSTTKYSVLLGRGCPFNCTYCCNHILKKLALGSYVRFRSPDNIIEELKELAIKFPEHKEVHLEIETITVNKKWALDLCEKLERFNSTLSVPLRYSTNFRVTPKADVEDLFIAFKKSNFSYIYIGLESGSERVRRESLKRNYSNEDIIRTVSMARKYGLKVAFYNMIGIPGETLEDFKETIRINRICLPDYNLLSIFYPYPGTELYTLCKEQGLLPESNTLTRERVTAPLDLPGFSQEKIQKSFIWFDYYVYEGNKPMYKIFSRVLVSKFKSKPLLNYIYRRIARMSFVGRLKYMLNRYE